MEKTIECPICEAEFTLEIPSNSVVRCPNCTRKFRPEILRSELSTSQRSASPNGDLGDRGDLSDLGDEKKAPKLPIPNVDGVVNLADSPNASTANIAGEQETHLSIASNETVERKPPALPVAMPLAIPIDTNAAESLPVAAPLSPSVGAESESKSPSLVAVRQRYKKRNRQRTYLTIGFASILGLIIAALATWFVIRLNAFGYEDGLATPEQIANDDSADSFSSNHSDNASASSPQSIQSSTQIDRRNRVENSDPPKRVDPPKPKKIELASLPPQKFRYLSRADIENTWLLMQPRLLTLTVHRAGATTQAVGLIVDSRGWVLTSFHAIAGATKIEVRASAKVIDDLYEADLLNDDVRGVIAHDAQRDLAIVSINRRFVTTFGGIGFGKKNDMVSGQYAIIAAPPSPENPYARVEIKVSNRFDMSALPEPAKKKAEQLKVSDPNNVWIESELDQEPLVGTMLFNAKGELNGVYTFSVDNRRYFLLTDRIESSIKNATDDPQPILTIASESQKKALADEAEAAIVTNDPVGAAARELASIGKECESFGWIATTDKQFSKLQTFAARMTEVMLFISENKDKRSERVTVASLKKQTGKWRKSISETIRSRNKKQLEDSQKMIELVAKAVKRPKLSGDQQYLPVFGKVYAAGIVSPDPDSVFITFGKDAGYLKAPYQDTGDVMLPDSEWLFFVKRDADRTTSTHRYQGSTFTAVSGQLTFAIGLPSSF